MSLRTLIVDDESLARERLRFLLSAEPDIEIMGECKNGAEALQALRAERVDLLFLDIQMPVMTGLEVARQMGAQHLPATVFVTAFQEHAVEAFSLAAADYLTKPFDRLRLQQTLERVRAKQASEKALLMQLQLDVLLEKLSKTPAGATAHTQRLVVRDGAKDLVIPVANIEWIEAADYYVSLHVKGKSLLLRESITDLASKLDPALFIRVHRSAIVNIDYVTASFREGPDEGTLLLKSGQQVRTSKSGRQRLAEAGAL